jgi:orotate phosphoribosyltransferase
MRIIGLAFAALTAVALAAPVTSPAYAEKIVIKHGDRGLHRGFEHHHARKVVIIKRGHRHWHD